MPRRAVLSDEQRAALLALPDDETLLIQHWTLSQDDLALIVRRRRPHNRLGFAIQLCALRYPGRLLRPGELIPHAPLAFVAEQLQVEPEVLADYAMRGPTRYEQLDALRDAFGFTRARRGRERRYQDSIRSVGELMRMFGATIAALGGAVEHGGNPLELIDEAVGWHRLVAAKTQVDALAELVGEDALVAATGRYATLRRFSLLIPGIPPTHSEEFPPGDSDLIPPTYSD